jgi:hypothetical protein
MVVVGVNSRALPRYQIVHRWSPPSANIDCVRKPARSATGFAADAISVVVAAGALKDAWRAIARALRRTPKAEKLRIQVGDHLDITVDLDWLAGQGDSVEAAVMKSIGASLIDLADRTK